MRDRHFFAPSFRLKRLNVALLILLAAGPVHAATYYVATTGNDANAGTLAAPFRTIAKGSQRLAAGDTLYIRRGTYAEAMWHGQGGFVFRNGTSMSAMTRYAAYPGEEVIVKPSTNAFVIWFSRTADSIEISGLVIDGTHVTSYAVKIDGSYASNQWPRVRLLRNEIRYGRMGIGGGGGCEIIGNNIHHMKQYGIYTAFDNGLMEGNIFHDNGRLAIHHFSQNKTVNNWIFRNNIFYRNGKGYYSVTLDKWYRDPAVIISRGTNNKLYNNLFYDNYAGIHVGLGAVDALIANNTVFGSDTYGIKVSSAYSGSLNARIVNNIAWGNKSSQIFDNATNTTLQANLTTDPLVVNAAAGDFHLRSGSPAINAGVNLYSAGVTKDFEGKPRPQTGPFEIGAYEYGGSTPPPPPGPVTDLNGDGITNVADVQIAVNQAVGASACAAGDVNKDGVCNVSDIQLVINKALGL